MNINENRKAVAYMRYSSDNQNENSIAYQRRAIYTYCINHNIDLVEEFVDEAFTATNDKRPGFQKMINSAMNKPDWDMVLVYDMSRFARKNSDAIKYSNMLRDVDIELISITQTFGNTNEGFLLEGITHLMNEFYSRNNSKHTHAGMKTKAEQCCHCGGIPPLGYDVDDTAHLVINEEEAEIVKLIFDMYELNYTYPKMAEVLNERGYRNKRGEPFTKTSFERILKQEKYTGLYVWNRTKAKNSKSMRNSHREKIEDEQVRIPGGCPVIITEEQFQRVKKLMDQKHAEKRDAMCSNHYMLSGLKILKCAECGSYLVGTKRKSRGREYTTYYCPKHKKKECSMKEISTKNIDTLVAKVLTDDLCSRNDLNVISNSMNKSTEYRSLKQKIKGNEAAARNILKALEYGCTEELAEKLRKLSAHRKELNKLLEEYTTNGNIINEDNIQEVAERFKKHLIESDDPEVKMYLRKYVEEIIVDKDDVTITFNIS